MTLTTNQSVYQAGQPVQMTFKETNTSTQPVKITFGPSIDVFVVSQGGTPVWRSNSGMVSQVVVLETLQPGQSLTLNSTWNATPSPNQSANLVGGTYTVTNQLAPQGPSATFQVMPAMSQSISTGESIYQAGQPIVINFTETNKGLQPITVNLAPTNFTITSNGATVWQSNPGSGSAPATTETLQPGQSVTQSAAWNDMISTSGTNVNAWGSFVVSNPNAPSLTSFFQVANPLVWSVTTNQSVYQVGTPVVITSTLTNTSTQPITISTVQAAGLGFAVSQNGSVIWTTPPASGNGPPVSASTETIQPGQSITNTATWNGVPSSNGASASPATGVFTASLVGNPHGPTATFQIVKAIAFAIATDQTTYQAGQPITITFTETNTSSQSVPVVVAPADFAVTGPNGNVVWQSGVVNPKGQPPGQAPILQPGQSITETATWNGVATHGNSSGNNVWGAFTVTNTIGAAGLSAAFTVQDPITATLTTNQTSYQTGQSVHITVTETNTSQFPVYLNPTGEFTVKNNLTGATVFSQFVGLTVASETLKAGQTVTWSATWVPIQAGNFSINYHDSAVAMTTQVPVAFAPPTRMPPWLAPPTPTPTPAPTPTPTPPTPTPIPKPPPAPKPPIVANVSTNQKVYRSGQAVVVTLTLENTTGKAITLAPNAKTDGFYIDFGSTKVWYSALTPTSVKSKTLAPGATMTLRTVWNGHSTLKGATKLAPGVYKIVGSLGGHTATATIHIVS
jgi:hypothetical protein